MDGLTGFFLAEYWAVVVLSWWQGRGKERGGVGGLCF